MTYFGLCIALLGLLIFNCKRGDSLFAPNQFLCEYWFLQIMIIVPVLGLSTWEYTGLMYIASVVAIFSVTFWYAQRNKKATSGIYETFSCDKNIILLLLIFTGAGILVHILSIIYMNHISFYDSVFHIGTVSKDLYAIRADGREKTSFISKLSLILLYTYPLLAGYYQNIVKNKYVHIIGFLFIAYMSLLQGTKSVLMTSVILWFSGWIVAKVECGTKQLSKYIWKIFLGIGLVLFLSFLGMFSRIYGVPGNTVNSALLGIQNIFSNYAFAHLLAFDHWFSGFEWTVFTGGQYTFFGIFNAIGLATRESGIFGDVLYIGSVHTNVYTVFRPLVTDFSPVGAVIFMAVVGYISGHTYKKVASGGGPHPLSVTVCVMVYAFILWGFVTSIFAYASYICAFVYFYLCQKLVIWKSRS